jgi:ABC-2 type transport system ATP-binding protein
VPAIEVESLRKSYGELVAVDGVSFAAEPGEIFALLGPNGAGKTTTVEILEGLRPRDGGDVRVLDADPSRDARVLAPRVGVMPQTGDLQQGLRVAEAVRLFAAFYDDAEDPSALMSRLGLDRVAATPYRRLSGGEKRRLSLALAVVGRPRVAFLDEPTAGMDVEGRATTWDLVRELRDRGVCVLLTTHLLDEAERVADRVGIMHRGRLVALGSPAELTGAGRDITFTVTTPIDEASLSSALGVRVELDGDRYRITGAEADAALIARLTAWLAGSGALLRRLEVGSRTLEDAYLELTGADGRATE